MWILFGKGTSSLNSVGHQKIVVLPFSLTTVALNWRLQGDLAGLPSAYSTVLRSSRTTSGLFSTTFNSNWKVNAVVWAIYRLVGVSLASQQSHLVHRRTFSFFCSEVDHAEIHFY